MQPGSSIDARPDRRKSKGRNKGRPETSTTTRSEWFGWGIDNSKILHSRRDDLHSRAGGLLLCEEKERWLDGYGTHTRVYKCFDMVC